MKNYTFHWELRTILAQFEQAFDDIVIKRYNNDKEPEDQIHVNFRFSPKTRTLSEIVNKNEHFKMPVVAISIGGIKRNVSRVFNKIDGTFWADTTSPTMSGWANLLQPVPVDITINMSIIARFQQDVDQIITNFIPYCDPYIVVSWKWPEIIPWTNFEIRSHILWNENIAYQYPLDINNSVPYRIIADTSFTIQSWMFKNMPPMGKPIYVIDTSFSAMSSMEVFEVMKNRETEDNTDYSTNYTVISARPFLTFATPFYYYLDNLTHTIDLYGKMLDYTDQLYLSTNNWSMFDMTSTSPLSGGIQWVQQMSGTRFISAFSGFSGIQVPSQYWNIISQNNITLESLAISAGFFDIIVTNNAGYGILSNDSRREITNPYPINSIEYTSYQEYQPNCVSGIEVRLV